MRHIIVLTTVVALFAGALGSFAFNALVAEVNFASSASEPATAADSQIQGDTDCDGDVDAVDGLGVLVDVAALGALVQQEPCTDISDVIPLGEGVPGPAGPQGEQGPPGAQGISGYELVEVTVESDASTVFSGSEPCPDGKTALGGGLTLGLGGIPIGTVSFPLIDGPNEDGDGWDYIIHTLDANSQMFILRFICANVAE